MNKRHFNSMVRSLKHDSLLELKAELKMQRKHVADTEAELAFLKSEIIEIEKAIREKLGAKAKFASESEKLLQRKAKTSVARWELFKVIANNFLRDRSWKPRMFMDRMPDGRLSVKIGDGNEFPIRVENALRSLADTFKVYDVCEYGGGNHRGTRFYFSNIPGISKYAKRKAA